MSESSNSVADVRDVAAGNLRSPVGLVGEPGLGSHVREDETVQYVVVGTDENVGRFLNRYDVSPTTAET
jgi:hypothetical protein